MGVVTLTAHHAHVVCKRRLAESHTMVRSLGFTALLLFTSVRVFALDVGIAAVDITPKVTPEKPVWLAGYGPGRKATGVHDALFARAVVLRDGAKKVAMVCVDLVGVQRPLVLKVREQLKDYAYVMVSSSHNHEGPDVIGIWGATFLVSGCEPAYMKQVADGCVAAVKAAELKLAPAEASYGTAEDEELLGDSRLPKVKDGVLRLLKFTGADGKLAGLLVQWNCHPESMGSKNTLITADFCWATVAALEKKHQCPVAYFSGAVGGLMAPPDGVVKDNAGKVLEEGDYEYARVYGESVATLAGQAVDGAKPIRLTPFVISAKPLAIPVVNNYYKLAKAARTIDRGAYVWAGDSEKRGSELTAEALAADKPMAIETEVAYLRLGELDVACIPGEIYPELVYGKFQEPAEPDADFPTAPLETPVAKLLPQPRWLLIGLANDEVGYIIPKRQWDDAAPFAYGRKKAQYGEINSCSPEVAAILMQALERRVKEAK